MNDLQFRAFLDLLMCSDPWPPHVNQSVLNQYADEEAVKRGHRNGWIDAYHSYKPMPDELVLDCMSSSKNIQEMTDWFEFKLKGVRKKENKQ